MGVFAHRSFPTTPASLAEIRRFVRETLNAKVAEQIREELNLAVSEAGANSILHSGSDRVEIDIALRPTEVEVSVSDEGVFRANQPLSDGGFGLRIMAATVDELDIRRGREGRRGTNVRLVKRLA